VIAVQTEIELVEFPVDLDAVPKELDSVFHFVTSCFFVGLSRPHASIYRILFHPGQ
jgi:hypothetical protein